MALDRLSDIYDGALQAALGNVTDPEEPSEEEMIAGVSTYFRRLGDEPFLELLRELAETTLPPIAEAELADLREKASERGIRYETRQGEGWEDELRQYLNEREDLFTGSVQNTTRQKVMAVVQEVMADDDFRLGGIDRIAREMDERIQGITRNRAKVTARTEIVSGSNRATQVGAERFAEASDTEMVKEWISTLDGRTRQPPSSAFNHRSPHGQIVPLDQPFTVSGEQMMHPGDYSLGASAGNLIQCRCTHAPVFREDVDDSNIE